MLNPGGLRGLRRIPVALVVLRTDLDGYLLHAGGTRCVC